MYQISIEPGIELSVGHPRNSKLKLSGNRCICIYIFVFVFALGAGQWPAILNYIRQLSLANDSPLNWFFFACCDRRNRSIIEKEEAFCEAWVSTIGQIDLAAEDTYLKGCSRLFLATQTRRIEATRLSLKEKIFLGSL